MDYEVLKNKIFYSKYMRALEGKMSPIKGYSDAGSYARENQRLVNIAAVNNGLDRNYCSVLALAQFLGLPPYGKEGEVAIKEVLGDQFNKIEIDLKRLADIAGESIEGRFRKDLMDLEAGDSEELSNEARCVAYVKEVLEIYSLLRPEEKEKLGGTVLKTAMVTGIKKGTNGFLEKSKWHQKMKPVVSGRKKEINLEVKNKIKEKIQKRVVECVLDEQGIVEKVLGE